MVVGLVDEGFYGFELVSNLKQRGCRVKRFFPVSKPVISRAFRFSKKAPRIFSIDIHDNCQV